VITQDASPRVCAEDLFGRVKTGGLGEVTMKKEFKKKGITRPHPDGRVIITTFSPFYSL